MSLFFIQSLICILNKITQNTYSYLMRLELKRLEGAFYLVGFILKYIFAIFELSCHWNIKWYYVITHVQNSITNEPIFNTLKRNQSKQSKDLVFTYHSTLTPVLPRLLAFWLTIYVLSWDPQFIVALGTRVMFHSALSFISVSVAVFSICTASVIWRSIASFL